MMREQGYEMHPKQRVLLGFVRRLEEPPKLDLREVDTGTLSVWTQVATYLRVQVTFIFFGSQTEAKHGVCLELSYFYPSEMGAVLQCW